MSLKLYNRDMAEIDQVEQDSTPDVVYSADNIKPEQKKSGPGFLSILRLLLLVVVVATISGGIGYFIGNYQKYSDLKGLIEKSAPAGFVKPTPNASQVPSPSPMASPNSVTTVDPINWKTYVSREYNFSFKYPDKVEEIKGLVTDKLDVKTVYDNNSQLDWFVVDPEKRSFEEFVSLSIEGLQIGKQENKTIGNIQGVWVEIPGKKGQLDIDPAHIEFYMKGDGNYHHKIRLYSDKDLVVTDSLRGLFTTILQTVK
jgi:hypothetical protein